MSVKATVQQYLGSMVHEYNHYPSAEKSTTKFIESAFLSLFEKGRSVGQNPFPGSSVGAGLNINPTDFKSRQYAYENGGNFPPLGLNLATLA